MMLDFTSQTDYIWALLPEIVLSLAAMLVLMVDVFQKGSRSEPSRPIIAWLAFAGVLAAAVTNGWLLTIDAVDASGIMALDGFRVYANFLFLLAAGLTILVSIGFLDRHYINRGEYYALMLFATVGMMLMSGTRDLMLLFIGLELMSLAVYVMVGFARRDPRSSEGALKYFFLGAFSSAFLLYGIALVFGATASTNLTVIGSLVSEGALDGSFMFIIGMGLLLIGFGFKIAAVPFHVWSPDAYEGAPSPVTGFMATAVKAAAFAAFIRAFSVAFAGMYDEWIGAVAGLAIVTMVVANLIAVTQGSVKRMLAYSSIAHAGYLIVAVAAANALGAAAFLFYLLVYTLMTIGAFAVVAANARGDRELVTLQDYAGFGWRHPLMGAIFSVFLLSLAGFPLTGGFIGKLYILRAALSAGHQVLAVILVLASAISYFYYLRVIVVMYMRPTPDGHEPYELAISRPAWWAVSAAAVAVLLLFFYPGPLLDAAQQSVASMFTSPGMIFGLKP